MTAPDSGPRLTVIGHIEELRRRIIVALVFLVGGAIVAFPFAPSILEALKLPAHGAIERLVYFSPEEAFLIYVRIGLIAGLVLSFPVIAWQAWAFIAPALGGAFKRHTAPLVLASAVAFLGGCAFAYYVLLPAALGFLLSIGRGELEPVISVTRYVSFVTGIILACGAVFEMPVVTFFLARAGILTAGMMRRTFKYALIVILIAAAIITPTADAFNMLMLALPMVGLYELSVWVAYAAGRKRGTP